MNDGSLLLNCDAAHLRAQSPVGLIDTAGLEPGHPRIPLKMQALRGLAAQNSFTPSPS
jgi:hypothetical protein